MPTPTFPSTGKPKPSSPSCNSRKPWPRSTVRFRVNDGQQATNPHVYARTVPRHGRTHGLSPTAKWLTRLAVRSVDVLLFGLLNCLSPLQAFKNLRWLLSLTVLGTSASRAQRRP